MRVLTRWRITFLHPEERAALLIAAGRLLADDPGPDGFPWLRSALRKLERAELVRVWSRGSFSLSWKALPGAELELKLGEPRK